MSFGCCGCVSLQPRYKRLVDNIFPVMPQDGLVKNNMEKLTFYALSSPEKLDRIGEYLYQKATRDIYRRRYGFVMIAMEAMDQLLIACHAQTLNLFVESFLKMVQRLLEYTDPQLQIMATQSFVRFANIEEDTPSYHLRYDFFVSKFSAMCHNHDKNTSTREAIRLAGIKGLQGVVRKTVSDDLVENIWEDVHMDKIVPSLLYNMQDGGVSNDTTDEHAPDSPPSLSEATLRELVGRASFGHMRSVLRPVLRHLDCHELWVPNLFATHTFKVIIYSVQVQYSYVVVESLMTHLDENSNAKPQIRFSIADVLSKIIAIAAGESVGPSVLEIINSILTHLETSVTSAGKQNRTSEEQQYQEALINALGEFANHLPDYQKIEIMMFIMNKVPFPEEGVEKENILLENILLKSLLKVGTKYQTVHFNTTFPASFLESLLRMSLAPDPEMRVLVQKILHTLIDRHSNLEKLLEPTVGPLELDHSMEKCKCSRSDAMFMRKHGPELLTSLFECLEFPNNTVDNVESVYTTLTLLTVELITDETMMDLIRFLLSVQDMTLTSTNLSPDQKNHLHALVISVFILIPNVLRAPALMDYAQSVVQSRRMDCPYLLPPLTSSPRAPRPNIPPSHLLDLAAVTEVLTQSGLDVARVLQGGYLGGSTHRHSWVSTGLRASSTDLSTHPTEADTVSSSPGQLKHTEEALNFDSMKKILMEAAESKKAAEEERRMRIAETFRTATFQELIATTQAKNEVLQTTLSEILSNVSMKESYNNKPPAYEIFFPELFVY